MVIKSTSPLQVTKGTSVLSLANFSRATDGESFSLTWASVPGKTYQVETSQSLLSNQWSDIGYPVTATATTPGLIVPFVPVDERRFYRVKVLP